MPPTLPHPTDIAIDAFRTDVVRRAAEPVAGLIPALTPEQLGAATPCERFDVRRLLNHLLFWGPSLAAAARKQDLPHPDVAAESATDLVGDAWAADLRRQLTDLAQAWSEPGAWQGSTRLGGPSDLPAALAGGMVVAELVVHGWDLGRAVGRSPRWDDDLLTYVLDEVAATAGLGRQLGIFGPEVAVDPGAPTLHRVLGITGRDPDWTA